MAIWFITAVDQPANEPISHICFRAALAEDAHGRLRLSLKPTRLSRGTVVTDLLSPTGDRYWTATALNGELWKRGAEVELTPDRKFITTKGNRSTRDNLGELPPCDC